MDGSRFDALSRSLATSRRGALKALLGGAVAGVTALTARTVTDAKPDKPKKPKGIGNPCDDANPCGDRLTCLNNVCTPLVCLIKGVEYEPGTRNPDNACEYCEPANTKGTWYGWRTFPDGTICGDPSGEPCIGDFNVCTGGECVLQPVADGNDCGDGQICCGGECCPGGFSCSNGCQPPPTPDDPPGGGGGGDPTPVPCQGADCPQECFIGGVHYAPGVTNPMHDCEICDPSQSLDSWSLAPDNSECGLTQGRACCGGNCCGPDRCCSAVGLCVFSGCA